MAAARDLISHARRLVILTGAGVSAESGVPTFRGPGGLWKNCRPEDLATPEAFARDPRLVWEWYGWRRALVAACAPNAAHLALARHALANDGVLLATQNVDGLHHRAADLVTISDQDAARAHPIEVHGTIHRDRCSGCGRRSPATATLDTSSERTLPRCAWCANLLRPDVVWFGEPLDPRALEAVWDSARCADVCLVIGTSSAVYPAAAVPYITLEAGGGVIEVNPDMTPLTEEASVSLRGSAAELVPMILQ